MDRVVADKGDIPLIATLILPLPLKVLDIGKALRVRKRKVRILVRGAPSLFDDDLWRKVGARVCDRVCHRNLL